MTNSARLGAWLLLASLLLSACTSAPSGRASKPSEPPPPRIEVRSELSAPPPTPPAPMPSQPAPPPFSVGPVRPPEPPMAPPPAPPAPPAPPSPPPPPGSAGAPTIVFNFDNADVELVIQAAAEIVGFNYVLAPAARGRKVTVQTIGRIAKDDVFNVLLTILDVNGLTAVKSGNLYRIIPREGAPQSSIRTVVGSEVDPSRPGDEFVTQIVTLKFISAQDAVNLLRPFVAGQGAVSLHRETNLIMITDTSANIRRLLDILKLADVKVALDELQIIPIRNADAQELALLLNQMFATGRLRTAASALGFNVAPPPFPAAPGAPPQPLPPGGAPTSSPADQPPLIVAERRSNSLVIHARKPEMDLIFQLVAKLDVDIYGGQRVFIYFVENTKAKELAATLDSIYGRSASSGARPAALSGGTLGAPPAPSQPAPALPRVPGVGGAEVGATITDLRFIADEVTNAIIVTTYPRLWRDIEETIKRLDRPARQVLIEVLAAEVTLNDDTKLGIEWAVRSGKFTFTNTQNTLPNSNVGVTPTPPGPGILSAGGLVAPGFNMFVAASEFIAALNALASENRVNVLSSPSIMTSENKKAVINVSQSVPIVTSQQVPVSAGGNTGNSITQAVEYKDAGIILTVTPRIGEKGTVALDVKQEVNDVGQNEPPPINSPRFTKREAETSVVLLNNQTLVLGGLIQTTRTYTKIGIPYLNRIPVLGYLFGSTEERLEKRELLLLITPRVVGSAADAARVTDQMRNVTPELEYSFKQAPKAPPRTPTPASPPPPPSR